MLQVQQYLRNQDRSLALANLERDYAIASKAHPTDNRIILDYDMIKSPKAAEIVRECRGLVLDSTDWSLVAKPFFRFFNATECLADDKKFNWQKPVLATHKEDGSLILLYFYNGNWFCNTRFSFADGLVNDSSYTWSDLVKQGLGDFDYSKLDKDCTYVLELCSPYNKIVRRYNTPQVYLLSVFIGQMEVSWNSTVATADYLGLRTPRHFFLQSIDEARDYIETTSTGDPTFEGVVIRDSDNNRLKIKSLKYLSLHRLANNGNVASVKNLLPLIMAGETSELLTYFGELADEVARIEAKLTAVKQEIDNIWFAHGEKVSPKAFALSIQKDTRYTAPLFSARKIPGSHPWDHLTVEYLLKNVFDKD